MTLFDVLHMFLGAGLVAFGVLAHSAALRMRCGPALTVVGWNRPGRPAMATPASTTAARSRAPRSATPREMPVMPEVLPRATMPPPAARFAAPPADDAMAKDVTSALVSAGYRKATVAAAVAACAVAERVSIESWTRAALRRCARGVA